MLKDLEKRTARHDAVPLIHLTSNQQSAGFFISARSIFFLSGLILFFIILSAGIVFFKQKQVVTATQMSSHTEIKQQHSLFSPIPADVKEVSWQKSVLITGITLQVKDNVTEITFLLNHAALYRLIDGVMQNQLSLIIDNSELQSELPPLDNLNTAIKHLTTQNAHGDTRFNLSFYPGSTIKYIDITDKDKNPQIVIAVEYHSAAVDAEDQMNKLIKTPAMQSFLSQQYQDALNFVEHGHDQSAIKQLSSLLKMDPGYKNARVTLAALLIDQGRQLIAKRIIAEGLNLNPDYIPFIELQARILTNEGKVKQAIALLQSASPSITDNPEYHAFIAALYEHNNDNLLAANLYKQLLTLNPHNGKWWLGLGISLEKLGHPNEAYAAYTKTLNEGHLTAQSAEFLQDRLRALKEVGDEAG